MQFVRIEFKKLISPDFFLGKLLVGLKSLCDIAWLLICYPSSENLKFARLVLGVKPRFTMVKNRNLRLLYDLVGEVNRRQLPGDIVECGVWNGGSAALMAAASMDGVLQEELRTVWLFDSFEGLPPPGDRDGDIEKEYYFPGWNKGKVAMVQGVFEKVGFPSEKLKIIPGWFNETLVCEPIRDISILHIDADWYESVKTVLQHLYHRVVPGGFIIIDDYGLWPGCESAVRDYFAENQITQLNVRRIGTQGAYFQKPCDKASQIHQDRD